MATRVAMMVEAKNMIEFGVRLLSYVLKFWDIKRFGEGSFKRD